MPRKKRTMSRTGIYHVILRGINQYIIFEDDRDSAYFLTLLKKMHQKHGFVIYAYCLMNNHIHLLLQTKDLHHLAQIMHNLETCFVRWYNAKYKRVGHLFQGTYRSFPIENANGFLRCIRYIHNNPVRAGIVDNPNDYKWSSSELYFMLPPTTDSFVNTEDACALYGTRSSLLQFLCEKEDDKNLFHTKPSQPNINDDVAQQMVLDYTGCTTLKDFPNLDKDTKNACIKDLYNEGLSLRQLSRLCYIPKTTIERIIRI